MKLKGVWILIVCIGWLLTSMGEPSVHGTRGTREFMRDKLQLSQHILEGLTTEKYDWVLADAMKLSAKIKDPGWRVLEHPEYEQQSAAFRATVDALVKAAKDRNLDAATLAYVRMTLSCVECHKFVRGKGVGNLQNASPKTQVIAFLSP